jgi:phosphoribosyl-ATP pyrophosphohydrolase
MIFDDLLAVIGDRRDNPRPGSYVSSLIAKGKDGILKKIGEEAIEVIVASKGGDRERVIHELADLWFHCMVLLHEEGLSHNDIFRELDIRSKKGESCNE